jgi:hypothetical protein
VNLNAIIDANIATAAGMDDANLVCFHTAVIGRIPRDGLLPHRCRAFESADLAWIAADPAERAERLRHWLNVERLFPVLTRKEISEVPG